MKLPLSPPVGEENEKTGAKNVVRVMFHLQDFVPPPSPDGEKKEKMSWKITENITYLNGSAAGAWSCIFLIIYHLVHISITARYPIHPMAPTTTHPESCIHSGCW